MEGYCLCTCGDALQRKNPPSFGASQHRDIAQIHRIKPVLCLITSASHSTQLTLIRKLLIVKVTEQSTCTNDGQMDTQSGSPGANTPACPATAAADDEAALQRPDAPAPSGDTSGYSPRGLLCPTGLFRDRPPEPRLPRLPWNSPPHPNKTKSKVPFAYMLKTVSCRDELHT